MRLSTGTEHATKVSSTFAGLPLPTLLSQVLVAFTMEFDNEAERHIQHRTTKHGSTGASPHAPWLVSMVLWSNCMQFVGEKGVQVGELEKLARTKTNLNGMQGWGYITVEPDPADGSKPPRSRWLIRVTPAGRKAQEVWQPLFATIENRWKDRFGKDEIGQLRESLGLLIRQVDLNLPGCLPILGYALLSTRLDRVPARLCRERRSLQFQSPPVGAPIARASRLCHRVRKRVQLISSNQCKRCARP